jgi:cytochrome b561
METGTPANPRYPRRVRWLHWLMAAIILGMLTVGFTMVHLIDDKVPIKFDWLYPYHKSFGMLVLLLVLVRLAVRRSARLPGLPRSLPPWERRMAKVAHVALYTLMILVPLMGYSLSSSFTQSDGVYFFGVNLPELLPKNDARFAVFDWLHAILAYTLLALIILHVLGALKHRFVDREKDADVLARML